MRHLIFLLSFSIFLTACRASLDSLPFEEDFEDAKSGWDVYKASYASTSYWQGKYLVEVHEPKTEAWGLAGRRFANVIVDVEARLVDGVSGDYGVLCRYQSRESFYYLGITSDGVGFILVNHPKTGLELVDQVRSDFIRLGWETNQLRAVCEDERLELYVNGALILQVADDRLGQGDIGLAAGTFGQPNTRVLFDDLRAESPSE